MHLYTTMNPHIYFIAGINYFHEILKEMSGREYTVLAKPSLEYAQYLLEKYNLGNPEKVLFIGDS